MPAKLESVQSVQREEKEAKVEEIKGEKSPKKSKEERDTQYKDNKDNNKSDKKGPEKVQKPKETPQERAKRHLELIDELRFYLVIAEVLLLILLCFLSMRDAGVTLEPFYMPFTSFAILVIALGVLINSQTNLLNHFTLKSILDPTRRLVRCADMMRAARMMVFFAIVFAIILLLPTKMPEVEDFMKSESPQTVPIGRASYYFDKSDPFEFISVKKVVATNIHNSEIDIYLEDKNDFDSNIFNNISKVSYRNGAWDFSESNGRAQMVGQNQVEFDVSDLPYGRYVIVYYNENATEEVNVKTELYREFSRSLLNDIFRLMVILAVANIIWHVRLYIHKKRATEESFIMNEQRAKEAEEKAVKGDAIIEDVFLIYEDGRLIAHNTRRLKPNMDDEILTGMLTAVQDFVKDSLKSEEKGMLDEMKFGNMRIFIESGIHVKLAVVTSGTPSENLRPKMREVLRKIHNRFGSRLEKWDGDASEFTDAKRLIMEVF